MSFETLKLEKKDRGHYHGGQGGDRKWPDPDDLMYILFHSKGYANSTGYSNPKIDALLNEARETGDLAKRKPLYSKVWKILIEDLPYVPMFFAVEYSAKTHCRFRFLANKANMRSQWRSAAGLL